MKQLDAKQMSSLEIAELTGKPHNDLMKAIRKMEVAWEKIGQGKFSQSSYTNQQGKEQPMPCGLQVQPPQPQVSATKDK